MNYLTEQIEGLRAQQQAVESHLSVVKEGLLRKKGLLDKGLTDRSEYTALLRSEADLIGQLGQARSSILSSRTQIIEAEEQYTRLTTQRVKAATSELNEVRSDIPDADEQTPKLVVPANITLLFLPPRAPALNPVENVWQFMRDN